MANVCLVRLSGLRAGLVAAGLVGLSACGSVQAPPTAQSVAGLTPVGKVTMTKTVAAGMTGGSGSLTFEGRTHQFILVGSVVGTGGASTLNAEFGAVTIANVEKYITETAFEMG